MSNQDYYQNQLDAFDNSLNENERYGNFYHHYKTADLIMLRNNQGNFFFATYGMRGNRSPVFKVKRTKFEGDQVYLQLIVMEVLYPGPLYRKENSLKGILRAVRDGMAVVKETNTVINFTLSSNYRVEETDLEQIYCVDPIEFKRNVTKECVCSEECIGQVEVKSKHKSLQFILTACPTNGNVNLNTETGMWVYKAYSDSLCEDCFEITVWDGLGSFDVQTIIIKCEAAPPTKPKILDVNVVNSPTVHIDQPIKITGNVDLAADSVITVSGISVELTGDPVVSISGVTLSDGAIPVKVIGASALEGITVSGVVDLDPNASVSISGTPTVLIDQSIEVTGFVGITGIPMVVIDHPIEVTGAVELTGDPTVSIKGLTLVDGAVPVEISGISVFDGALTIAGAVDLNPDATVSINGTPTVIINQPISISYIRSFTSIELENSVVFGTTTITTPAVDVSRYIDYSFIVYFTHTFAATSSYTVLTQIGALNNDGYFFNDGSKTGIIDGLDTTANVVTLPDHLAQYARLVISASTLISESSVMGLSVQAYFQGQY